MAALVRGGIEQVEVTIDTPGALEAVADAAGEGRTVGVGTVVDSEQVRASAAAGARFVVSPGLVPEVIETALDARARADAGRLHGDRDPDRDRRRCARDEALPGVVRRAFVPACAARPVPHGRAHPDGRRPDRRGPGLPRRGCDGDRARQRARRPRRAAVGRRARVDRSSGRPRDGGRARRRAVRRRRASDAALRARDAGADRRSRRDRAERLPDAGLLRRARGRAAAAHQDAQAARARAAAARRPERSGSPARSSAKPR